MRRLLVVTAFCAALLSAVASQAQPPCSQPASLGDRPILHDCVVVARASVGIGGCADCVCDVDGSGRIQMSDGLRCLRYVVGSGSSLACPACLNTTTTTTLPGCASCNDVLTERREYDELCPLAKLIYDDMVECPDVDCSCACEFLHPCAIEPWACVDECPNYPLSTSTTCLLCFKNICGMAARFCSEN